MRKYWCDFWPILTLLICLIHLYICFSKLHSKQCKLRMCNSSQLKMHILIKILTFYTSRSAWCCTPRPNWDSSSQQCSFVNYTQSCLTSFVCFRDGNLPCTARIPDPSGTSIPEDLTGLPTCHSPQCHTKRNKR